MADDLRVRVVWQNDEASLRAAMQQAQQMLQNVQGAAGYGTVAGAPTPAAIAMQGGIRAAAPTGLLNAQGQPIGTTTQTIVAPPPAYNQPGQAQPNQPNQPNPNPPNPPNRPFGGRQGGGGGIAGPLGYAGRMVAIRGIFSAVGAIGEAAQQQQQLSDMNRRVGDGVQQWRAFEDTILKVGMGLGATRAQMIELTNTFVSSVGRMGTQATADTVRSGMVLAKRMGIAPESVIGFESNTAKFLQGPNTDFGKLGAILYNAVQQGMQGREEEVIKAIDSLTQTVGERLPDLGSINGIGATLASFSGTGIQGLMGQRGAQVMGGLDQFLTGGGSDIQQMMSWRAYAGEAKKNGGSTRPFDIQYQMEEGINGTAGINVLKTLVAQARQMGGREGQAFLSAQTGQTLHTSEALINSTAVSGIDLANIAKSAGAGVELTKADKNTELMVDAGRAMQQLGENLVNVAAPAMNLLAHNIGLLTAAIGLQQITGVFSPGIAKAAGGVAGAFGVGGLGSGAAAMAGGAAGATAGGLLLGGLGSLAYDKVAHPGEATTLDMLLQMFGVTTPWSQVPGRGGPGSPLLGHGITQGFGHTDFDPFHTGLDLNYKEGEAITLPFGAKVIGKTGQGIGYDPLGGNEMLLSGPGNKEILLAHLSAFEAKVGDMVEAGGVIGYAGNTGKSTGTHLHFQTMDPGPGSWASRSTDPLAYLNSVGGQSFANNTVNHELTVNVKQPDGSTDRFKKSLTDRSAITSPNWGVNY